MFAAPQRHDPQPKPLYSHVIVMSDRGNEPLGWGSATRRLARTGEGNGNSMAQQQNPDDWVKTASIRELGDAAEERGITLAHLIDQLTA